MRIIAHGHLGYLFRQCRYCGAKLEIVPTDLKRFFCDVSAKDDFGNCLDEKNFFAITCPACGKAVRIGISQIPDKWKGLSCLDESYRYYFGASGNSV